jgi:hypothetical protein
MESTSKAGFSLHVGGGQAAILNAADDLFRFSIVNPDHARPMARPEERAISPCKPQGLSHHAQNTSFPDDVASAPLFYRNENAP